MEYTQGVLAVTKQDIRLDRALADIQQAFATVSDPRCAQGRVYWLSGGLCLAVAAILCANRSVLAIAEWGQPLSPELSSGYAGSATLWQGLSRYASPRKRRFWSF